jgi:mRNA interferase RelE/StbE
VKRYTLQFARPARKELEPLPKKLRESIIAAIEALQDDPRPHGCKKLKGSKNAYRIRVGDYRVVYEVYDDKVVVFIVRVRHRKDAYR